MRGLHRGGHAEPGEAREVRRGGAAARARSAAAARRGAQRSRVASSASRTARLAASPIACTASSRPASAQRAARSRSCSALSSASPRPASANGSSIDAVREPSVPSANALTGPMRSHSSPSPLRSPSAMISSSRSAGSEAQTRSDRRRSACSRCQAASPLLALEVVNAGHAPRVGRAQAVHDGLVELALAQRRNGGGGIPGGGLAQHPGRLARRVALDDRRGADRQQRERSRGEPGGVVVVRPEQHGSISAGRVQRLTVRLRVAGGPARRAPPGTDQPAVRARGGARGGRQHLGMRARARQIEPRQRERPLQEMHVRIREARDDAATVQIDALAGDARAIALAHVDAAADAVAGDGERPRQRQPGSPVRTLPLCRITRPRVAPSLSSAQCCRPRRRPTRSLAASRRSRPGCGATGWTRR